MRELDDERGARTLPAREALVEMVDKYRLLVELGRGEPGRTTARRDAMRTIAARFPAALREWDALPAEVIVARLVEAEAMLAALDEEPTRAAARLEREEAAWLRYAMAVHARLPAAMSVKRFLGGRATSGGRIAEASRRFGLPAAEVARIAAPPAGRVSELVYRDAAAACFVTVEALKAALYPRPASDDASNDAGCGPT